MKQAIGMVAETWWLVEPSTVVKCLQKTGMTPVESPKVKLEEDQKPNVVFELVWYSVASHWSPKSV